MEKNALDYDLFAQQYERAVSRMLTCELRAMNGEGASMKVLPVISFVIGDTFVKKTGEDYAKFLSEGYARPTWRAWSVLPDQPQYLGVMHRALTFEEHWEMRSQLHLEGLEGTAEDGPRKCGCGRRCRYTRVASIQRCEE